MASRNDIPGQGHEEPKKKRTRAKPYAFVGAIIGLLVVISASAQPGPNRQVNGPEDSIPYAMGVIFADLVAVGVFALIGWAIGRMVKVKDPD